MKYKNLKKFIIGTLISMSLGSCNYLDVSDEVSGGIASIDEIFENVDYTKRWYGQCFANTFLSSDMWFPTSTPTRGNPYVSMSDECYSKYVHNAGYYSEWNSSGDAYSRWASYYQTIRQANIFLDKAHPIEGQGTEAAVITTADMKWYKANVRFMRAYYYLCLMELYGPIPIITTHYDSVEEDMDVPRSPLEKVIKFIDEEIRLALPDMRDADHRPEMESYRAVPTKGAALATRAKLWIYAASPLFNGGYTEALQVKNLDGERLFPDKDDSKWEKALSACQDLIDYAELGNYELYKELKNGVIDASLSTYNCLQRYNAEMIWATGDTAWGGMDNDRFDKNVTPRSEKNGTGQFAVYQELVDDFYMTDGKPIKETSFLPKSTLYTETGFGRLDGIPVSRMYLNREARFYNAITFSGKKWHISGKEVQFYKGGNADNSSAGYYPRTGYLLYKRMNKETHKDAPGSQWVFRPSVIYRLAEFYLLYAEALNEVNPADERILEYVNRVRTRAGLSDLEVLNPNIKGDQAMQREAIRRESRIELCAEGQRYFDIRRWMIAEKAPGEGGLNGAFHGMNLQGDQAAFHQRVVAFERTWKRKAYLHPVPYAAMQKSHVLVQNPGW